MSSYKLVYFNFRGRAELIRWIFEVAEQKYDDFRFEREEWPKYKPDAPFGQLPYLEVTNGSNTFKLPQSHAIARYLSRKFNLAGKTEEEQALVDAFTDQINDLINAMVATKFFSETDPTKKAEIGEKIISEILPSHFKLFDAKLAENKGWFVGTEMTWADMYLAVMIEWLGPKKDQVLLQFPECAALEKRVKSHPKIAEWINKRPVTEL